MQKDFNRIAIVNRGEPAMRLIHAVREFNMENNASIRTIALFTEPDRKAMFVREADEAVFLGEATYYDELAAENKISYLNYSLLEKALKESKAEAAWVGWGFVAEHPGFADLCKELGIAFIGPDGNIMRKLGDKITSKLIAGQANVPVAPWSGGPVETIEEARKHAGEIGYPVVIKATAGGGGRGIRKIYNEAQLENAFSSARTEALKAFGDDTVFIEKMMKTARHVEVQIIADYYGNTWALGVRDCTIQRRHQKILEESPSPALSAEQDLALREAAVRLAKKLGYQNAGTVEFLYDPRNGDFYFMEVNARLQVEHPVTELTTAVDLVKMQLYVARGGKLEGEPPPAKGHAIEVRLNAEDPTNAFAPAPGVVELFRHPGGPGLRVDTGVAEGDSIPAEFDSMIAKIISYGRTRKEALSRLRRALMNTSLVIRGGMSNKGFLLDLLNKPEVVSSEVDVSWMDHLVQQGNHLLRHDAEVALIHAAIEAYLAEIEVEKAKFFSSAHRGRPHVSEKSGLSVDLRYEGESYTFLVHRLGLQEYQIDMDGNRIGVLAESIGEAEWRLTIGNTSYRILSMAKSHPYLIEVNGSPHRISRDQGGVVRAPSPAVVTSVTVKVSEEVDPGDRLAVIEAMKMEMSILAEYKGTVKQILVRDNVQVDPGTPLMVVEPTGREVTASGSVRLNFSKFAKSSLNADQMKDKCRQNMDALACLMRGFDADVRDMNRIMEERGMLCVQMPADDNSLWERENEVLAIFVDIISLFRRDPAIDDELQDAGRHSSEEYLFTYLLNTRAGDEGLPQGFLQKLKCALEHYGVNSIDPGPELDLSLFRICKSYMRMPKQIAPILSILERRLENAAVLRFRVNNDFKTLLDKIIAESRDRFPTVHDLAREVRYVYYQKPVLDGAKKRIYDEVENYLRELEENPLQERRNELIRKLVECPQALKSLLSNRFENAGKEMQFTIIEVMTRRYYRIRKLENVRSLQVNGRSIFKADYELGDKRIHVVSTHSKYTELENTARDLCALIIEIPTDQDVMLDFYVQKPELAIDQEETAQTLLTMFNQIDFPRPVRRIVVATSAPESGMGMSGVRTYTFRPSEEGFWEEKSIRGMHPMMAIRLEIWRLRNFNIEQLPSVEDVYLFKGVARDNPKDVRLFGFAEVRDLTMVGYDKDRVVQLPTLEMMIFEVLAGIRHYLAKVPPRSRPFWNRVLLYIWPPLDLKPEELQGLINKIAPATAGLGLEKVVARVKIPQSSKDDLKEMILEISNPAAGGLVTRYRELGERPIRPLTDYAKKVVQLSRRGLIYPYELIRLLTPSSEGMQSEFPPGEFIEYDLDDNNKLVPVKRPFGLNKSKIVVGLIRNYTQKFPEGMTRVILLGDPSVGMGSLAEPECRRIIAGIDLAREMKIPVEWFAVSSGAKISMESGTENMDWIALVLRWIVNFTQEGREINIIVTGINVGAQPYWNAEATMLMHTRGILIMTPVSAMVLTGKQALDYSGGVSAEDNNGIGGYERIMGPNGQAQYFAHDLGEASKILLTHYDLTYILPGEKFPRKASTTDPPNRDVQDYPHGGEFKVVGEVFSPKTNPGRKKPFEIRQVMRACIDQDHEPLERWFAMRDAEIAVVWDAHIGGIPVCLLGLESKPLPRLGVVPADGPAVWTSGTLFPLSSKKVARAINAASNNRPVVVLANLSGFDGSPESMRKWQLEYGAEIGRAVVNFKGPIIFCVISRYHGGAFVVFSNRLNDNMEVAALEGTYASVIGGAPAAAVVFAREVKKRTEMDSRILTLEGEIALTKGAEKVKYRSRWNELYQTVYSEKLGEVAEEFDSVHSVQRALKVGSVNKIIPPQELRPYLIDAIERGMNRVLKND